MEYKVNGHTVEIRYSGSSSVDPWTRDYADKVGVILWGTDDVAEFALVDGEDIYHLRGGETVRFADYIDNGIFGRQGMFEEWLDGISGRKVDTLSASISRIDRMKEEKHKKI